MSKYAEYVLRVTIFAICYYVLGKIAMSIAVIYGSVSPFWPASGLALGGLLRFGYGILPGIFAGAMLANYFPGFPLSACLLASIGNTASVLLGTFLIKKGCNADLGLHKTGCVLRFIILGGLISPILEATFGIASLALTHSIQVAEIPFVWFSLWLSAGTGIIVVAPLIFTLFQRELKWDKPAEFILLTLLVIVTGQLIFGGWIAGDMVKSLTFKFLLLPYYVWLIFRFGPKEIAITTLSLELVAIGNAYVEFGTLTDMTQNELVFSLQAFIIFIMSGALILNAMVEERRRMMADLARLEKLNLIGEMAAGIAHEIRNPMTTIRGFLQMLSSKQKTSDQVEYFTLMISELDRANAIITEYLMLAKNKSMQLKEQSINEIIEAIQPLIAADALNSDKYIEVNLGKIPDIPLDEKEIRQLVLNLVRNGLEAMDPGGTIHIKTFAENDKVVITIRDEGNGIAPDILKNLGTPFMTTKANGTGLGLAVSYSIVVRHKGTITVDTGSEGTTFTIKF